MTNIQDLGEITATTVEWTTRYHYQDGAVRDGDPVLESEARFTLECVLAHLADPSRPKKSCEKAELVSRTRTGFADGGTHYTAWQVTE